MHQPRAPFDHRNDPAVSDVALYNKTPETVALWIGDLGIRVLMAVDADIVLGVAAMTGTGTVTFDYVSPDVRFRGISKALVAALQARAVRDGHARCTFSATDGRASLTVAVAKELVERGKSQPPADSGGS